MNIFKAARLYARMKPYLEMLEGKPLGTLIKNWKTTLAGVIGLFVVLGTSLGWLTQAQAQAIGAVAASFGLLAAKDFNVTGGSKAIAFLLLITFAGVAHAQTPVPDPQYFLAAGGSYNRYALDQPMAAGWLSGAVKVAANTYQITTLDLTQTTASLRAGVAQRILQSGNFTLLLHADGGFSTGTGVGSSPAVTLGAFSGGGMILYDLGGLIKAFQGKQLYAVGVLRILGVSSAAVQPVFEFGVGKAF